MKVWLQDMFVVIISDGDIDYTSVYGPFGTYTEAKSFFDSLAPADFGNFEVQARVIELESKEDLVEYFNE